MEYHEVSAVPYLDRLNTFNEEQLEIKIYEAARSVNSNAVRSGEYNLRDYSALEKKYPDYIKPIGDFFKQNVALVEHAAYSLEQYATTDDIKYLEEFKTTFTLYSGELGLEIEETNFDDSFFMDNPARLRAQGNRWVLLVDNGIWNGASPLLIRELMHEFGAWWLMTRSGGQPNDEHKSTRIMSDHFDKHQTKVIDRAFHRLLSKEARKLTEL